MTFQEARALEDSLRFLMRVHDLRTVVLIAHEGCAYYRERLGVPDSALLAEQRQDLEKAGRAVRRFQDALRVDSFLARRSGVRIRFEPL